jgi:hypothetical protein
MSIPTRGARRIQSHLGGLTMEMYFISFHPCPFAQIAFNGQDSAVLEESGPYLEVGRQQAFNFQVRLGTKGNSQEILWKL